ncbi:MAG: hydrogenase maturation nickel metallochaperone HypA [candidate division KSB1 bacterium]|nr:hydrogenase maturation nickel metallochaperone HypA [candidate division KSB1 bacterium]MDZ7274113.1 hydrogenase maturation nickel metallochaperone HypA [candidate division KSB1 bacterium]MDZ7287843.1 hydrogenase maturation nickel metallochaperone HypA [candidate division KSB1 bacterium]MDZ7296711.1 hydrogenase maturation nickel metallochaperone HypA [candidate division KSB1 bacterium]MDZ7309569.1 hydrogenase maturation nickel metallochaperone HypA [candidate division KSB1 bacterium]
MHELSIATAIVETVLQEMQRRQLPAVSAVGVRVGALSGVVPDALEFSFQAIINGTPLAGARLAIEQVPLQGKCRNCGLDFSVQEFIFACPDCHSGQIEITRGEELEIAYLEVSS